MTFHKVMNEKNLIGWHDGRTHVPVADSGHKVLEKSLILFIWTTAELQKHMGHKVVKPNRR